MDNPQTWVKVFGIVGIILSAFGVLAGLAMIVGGSFFGSFIYAMIPGMDMMQGGGAALLTGILVGVGVVMIIVEIFLIFNYVKLMKYANWARIVTIVVSVLGVLGIFSFSVLNMILAIYYAIVFYMLTFQKEVVALFSAK